MEHGDFPGILARLLELLKGGCYVFERNGHAISFCLNLIVEIGGAVGGLSDIFFPGVMQAKLQRGAISSKRLL